MTTKKKSDELLLVEKELSIQIEEKDKLIAKLIIANKELEFQKEEKKKRAAELGIANIELAFQKEEKVKRAAELGIANIELAYQDDEKGKRAAELGIANKELVFQDEEKEKRKIENIELEALSKSLKQASQYARSLIEASLDPLVTISPEGKITDVNEASINVTGILRENLIGTDFFDYFTEPKKALEGHQKVFENGFVSNYPLTLRHTSGKLTEVLYNASVYKDDKGNVLGVFAAARDITAQKAEELIIANKELAFQNEEKEKRAAELIIAIKELAFQNEEKEKRAAELSIANKELVFQNEEKEKRAAELGVANKELAFQNEEKEKRAAELVIANKELAFQNEEKEKRAGELIIANEELAFQNEEKEKRAAELSIANKELLAFTYISSHDLQEPLRKIQTFVTIILENENKNLSEIGKHNFQRMQIAAKRMQQLIDDLLAFSRINTTDHKFEKSELGLIIEEVKTELKDTLKEKNATIESSNLSPANIIPFQFRQLMYNLISNALKFSNPNQPSLIIIESEIVTGNKQNNKKLSPDKKYCHIRVKDNGIGFEPHFSDRIFGVFQKLHSKEIYSGTGIGLAIVKKIVENHNGNISATSELGKGATFDIYIPDNL
jgi:PAS domain S-box-containing protein